MRYSPLLSNDNEVYCFWGSLWPRNTLAGLKALCHGEREEGKGELRWGEGEEARETDDDFGRECDCGGEAGGARGERSGGCHSQSQ